VRHGPIVDLVELIAMSQETCREQPTRCGLRDTVRRATYGMKRTAGLRRLEQCFGGDCNRRAYARALSVGSAQAAGNAPLFHGAARSCEPSQAVLRGGHAANQIFLLRFAFCADGHGVEHTEI
jgi:hypothetical protein